MTSRGKRIAAAVFGLVVIGGVVGFSATRDSRNRIAVQTGKAAKADLVSTVSASGEIKPKKYVNVSANVSGRITDLLVVEGQRVRKGQVLARIDSTRLEAVTRQSDAAVQSARADLARAEADVDLSQLNFDRARQMWNDKLISEQTFQQSEADLKMKQAALESAKKRIAQLQAALDSNADDLEKTTVVSPMDGVVTSLQKEEGEVVIGAPSFSPTVIMQVADLSVMETEILVDETDIQHVALGQKAEIRVDALQDTKVVGVVTEIGSSAIPRGASGTATTATSTSTANQAKDFKVTITLENPPASLRPGLNATADITTAVKKSVVAVPIQAVVVRELDKDGKVVDPGAPAAPGSGPGAATTATPARSKHEEKDGVFVVVDGAARFRPVKTGLIGETEIEILDGLKEGEELVTGSYRTLRTLKDEAKIKVEAPRGGRS